MSVPERWQKKKLGDVVSKVGSGVTPTGGSTSYVSQGVPLIRSQNVMWGSLDLSDVAFITEFQNQKMSSSSVMKDDILLNITGASIGRACLYSSEDRANVNQHVCILRPAKNCINPEYLMYFILSDLGQNQVDLFQAGGNRQGLNFEQVRSFNLLLPPLPEQRRIATILSQWDDSLSILAKLIEAKRQQKRGLAEQLLMGKRRLKGFDGEWEETKLGDIASMSSGGTPKSNVPEYYGGGIPWVSISDMTKSGKYLSTTERTLTPLGIKDSAAKVFPKGTILFAMYASIGKCNILRIPAATSQAILGIIPIPKVSPDYIYYFLAGNEEKYSGMGQHGTQKNLNAGMVKDLDIFVPPLPEQRAIASILSTHDEEITMLNALKAKVQEQKRGLMDLLLTGKVRVKVEEASSPERVRWHP